MIRLSKASVDDSELQGIAQVFKVGTHFGLGVTVGAFESDLANFIDRNREVVCVNTGTSALHIALEALGFDSGSEVIVPSVTYLASFSAISAARLKAVACEVNFPSCHIDLEDCRKRITSKTKAIMPVAYAGVDFDRKGIYQLANEFGLRVIEDNAHAFGGLDSLGDKFGKNGDIVCFSFDGIKNITCGEGGAVLSSDKEFIQKVRVIRSLGVEKDVALRYQGKRAWEFDVKVQGLRYHMSNINAAIGIAQLKKIDFFREKKRILLAEYFKNIKSTSLNNYFIPTQTENESGLFHLFNGILDPQFNRERVREILREKGIESGIHYQPNHLHSFYKTQYHLPRSERIGMHTLTLPFHVDLELDDVRTVVKTLDSALQSPEARA